MLEDTERLPADEDGPTGTLHQRILGDIEGKIVSGTWPPGYRIPFEVELARQYGCSRMTVNKALTQLAKAGLIERIKRSGSFVRRPVAQSAVLEIHDIALEVEQLNLPYSFEMLSRTVRAATEADRLRLDVPAGGRVLALRCLHKAASEPFCLEDRLISLSTVPEGEDADFGGATPGSWLLAQVPWTSAEHRIQAVGASQATAQALAVDAGAACLSIERRTWSGSGPVTHVRFIYPGDRHALVARFTPES
ncbi:histidine utilization repressor [Pelagibacterium montanilacus]|uniref:histidine utilization repressor n=1 Tax=Pelagibacterium montanilacus TaxID=2185280 RepID=UPI000F8EA36B|nr:histidine utilization repressor [Pelagibacterium montanilacus]